MKRREFVRASLATLSAGALGVRGWPPPITLPVGILLARSVVSFPSATDILSGAQLALSETERAGQLFGQRITLIEARFDGDDPSAAVTELISAHHASVIVAGIPDTAFDKVSGLADRAGALCFNTSATSNTLRREHCRRTTYHIAPSDAMVESAKSAAGNTPTAITIELWHESLERYGAAQLNDRYRARFSRPMTSSAWAGWVAVKIAWEASLRAHSSDPRAMLSFLGNDAAQFDGHKGTPLSFRVWDHQLRQPLYAVSGGRVVAELPDVGKSTGETMRAELDRFGDNGGYVLCGGERIRQ